MTRGGRSVGGAAQSCGRGAREVKRDAGSFRRLGRRPGYRHLEGWELAVVAIGIAALAAALAVPRGAEPEVFPLPHIDRKEVTRAFETEQQRAAEAERDTLPFEARAVGEALRQYGRADADGDASTAAIERTELRRVAGMARARVGDAPLLRLRAVQTLLFVAALERWESGGNDLGELEELGGAFLDKARSAGWLTSPRRLAPTEAERATLFRIRWTELCGLLDQSPFSPSANEWRVYYRFLLDHPEQGGGEALLSYVSAVEKYDPDYPASLARGIIQLRLGRPALAVESLTAYLAAKPNGRWRLRAQNHLAHALALTNSGRH